MIRCNNPFLLIDIEGTRLSDEDRVLLSHPAVAGVVLFDRNDQDKAGLSALIGTIKQINSELIIAVDQEGGAVQRFRKHFDAIPAMHDLGQSYEDDPHAVEAEVKRVATRAAIELQTVGINLNFSPVLDIHSQRSRIIGAKKRSFHHDAKVITRLAQIWINAFHAHDILVVGKHFPGHGLVAGDTHTDRVFDDRSFESIWQRDLYPYRVLNNELDAIMTSHVVYTHATCDANNPATTSKFWLHDILRGRIGFKKFIFTDCLSMESVAQKATYTENLNNALSVGCDFVLMCNCREQVRGLLLSGHFDIKAVSCLSRLSSRVIQHEHA